MKNQIPQSPKIAPTLVLLVICWLLPGEVLGQWTPVPALDFTPDNGTGVGAATFKGRPHLFAVDTGGHVHMDMFDGVNWTGWTPVPTGINSHHQPAAVEYNGTLYLFVTQDGSTQIFYNTYDDLPTPTWHGWHPVTTQGGGGVFVQYAYQSVTAVSHDGKLDLFYNDSNNLIFPGSPPGTYVAMTSFNGVGWTDPVFYIHPNPPLVHPPVAAAKSIPPRLYLFDKGNSGGGYNYLAVQDTSSGVWSGWTPLVVDPLAVETKIISAAAGSSGNPYIYWLAYDSVDGRIYFQLTDGATFSSWSPDPSGERTYSGLAAVDAFGDFYEFANLVGTGISWRRGIGWDPSSFVLVNMIPHSMSGDLANNTSPELAALGMPPGSDAIIASSSQPSMHDTAFFNASAGGLTWTQFQNLAGTGDATMKWSPGGTVYAALTGFADYTVVIPHCPDPPPPGTCPLPPPGVCYCGVPIFYTTHHLSHQVFEVLRSPGLTFSTLPSGQFPDDLGAGGNQIWPNHASIDVVRMGLTDRIYVGFSDDGGGDGTATPRSAEVRYTLDATAVPPTWNLVYVDQGVDSGCSPARVAAARNGGTKVYALFNRYLTPYAADGPGQVVVVRDDAGGPHNFADVPALGPEAGKGTIVFPNMADTMAGNTKLPYTNHSYEPDGPLLPYLRYWERNAGAIAVDPNNSDHVLVAFVYLQGVTPRLRLCESMDGGENFNTVWPTTGTTPFEADDTVSPALAVANHGVVGLLYREKVGGSGVAVHFVQGVTFSAPIDRVLAQGPRTPGLGSPDFNYGEHMDLEAVGDKFYGIFSFDNTPDPAHFPSRVYYQRNVKVGSLVQNNSFLTAPGTLVDYSGNPLSGPSSSSDPFFFYADATMIRPASLDVSGSNKSVRLRWSEKRKIFPDGPFYVLESSLNLGPQAQWSTVNAFVSQTNNELSATVPISGGSMFFRLRQQPIKTNSLFSVQAFAGGQGTLNPKGNLPTFFSDSIAFTATPNANYGVDGWYVDGSLAKTGGNTFTLNAVQADHTVVATFKPLYDLSLTKFGQIPSSGFVRMGSNVAYTLIVANLGLKTMHGITVTDPLPSGTGFVSASSTQGNCTFLNNTVTCLVGTLDPGDSASITLTLTPSNVGMLTNSASVYGNESEPELSNNEAAAIVPVGIKTLTSAGSGWRYLDNGSDQGSAWRSANFDDSTWNSGPAELGYGEGDEATVVGYGSDPTNRYITTYFRQTFQVADPADFSSLMLNLKRDDGAVAYLNGSEVFRSNMSTGLVNYLTLAASETSGPNESAFFSTMLNSNLLHSGVNLLAVEVHQASPASDDLSFDLELTGYLATPQPPTIVQQPAPNQTVSTGSFVSFSVQAAGTSPLSYQWYHNNAPIAGATLPAYTIASAQVADAGIYSVRVLNAFGSAFSNGANLSVSP